MKQFDSNTPIYMQLCSEIEEAIVGNLIKADEQIPSLRVLAQQYQINPITVTNAVTLLVNERYLYKKRGVGFFVASDAKERLTELKRKQFEETELHELVKKAKALTIELEVVLSRIKNIWKEA